MKQKLTLIIGKYHFEEQVTKLVYHKQTGIRNSVKTSRTEPGRPRSANGIDLKKN